MYLPLKLDFLLVSCTSGWVTGESAEESGSFNEVLGSFGLDVSFITCISCEWSLLSDSLSLSLSCWLLDSSCLSSLCLLWPRGWLKELDSYFHQESGPLLYLCTGYCFGLNNAIKF